MACADGTDHSNPLGGISKLKNKEDKKQIKICLLGPSESGKSEFVKCLIKGNPHRSMGVSGSCFVHGLLLEYESPVLLDVTECRGDKSTQLSQAKRQKADVYFLLYDVSSSTSFKDMRNKWLVGLYPQNTLTIVIGNKADMPSTVDVKIPGVSKTAWESGHFEISSITGQKVDYLIRRTAEIVVGMNASETTRSITQALSACNISQDTPSLSYYDMDAKPKGICLIISVRQFADGQEYRYGTEKDETNLSDLFKSFGFTVEVKVDLTGSQITETIKEMAKRSHSNYRCFISIVMSHGSSKSIYASDGMKIDVDQITKNFTAEKSPTLRGKPKLFFFQSCRGGEKHQSLQYDTDSMFGDDEEDATAYIPNEADFLIARSTVDGYVSYRNPSTGSYYITQLVDILKGSPNMSVVTCMTKLNERIANMNFTDGTKQMPCFQTTLRKELILG